MALPPLLDVVGPGRRTATRAATTARISAVVDPTRRRGAASRVLPPLRVVSSIVPPPRRSSSPPPRSPSTPGVDDRGSSSPIGGSRRRRRHWRQPRQYRLLTFSGDAESFGVSPVGGVVAPRRATEALGGGVVRDFSSSPAEEGDGVKEGRNDDGDDGDDAARRLREREERLLSLFESDPPVPPSPLDFDIGKETTLQIRRCAFEGCHDYVVDWIEKMTDYVARRLEGEGEEGDDAVVGYRNVPFGAAVSSLLSGGVEDGGAGTKRRLVRADELMDRMLRLCPPCTAGEFRTARDLYGGLVAAWSRCPDDRAGTSGDGDSDPNAAAAIRPAERAERWLRRWIDHSVASSSSSPSSPDNDGDAGGGNSMTASLPPPTALIFGCVVDAHAKSSDPTGAGRAERIMDLLLSSPSPSPSSSSSSSSHAAAVELPEPNTVMYTSLIDAHARRSGFGSSSDEKGGPARAEYWLRRMEREYDEGDLDAAPNVLSYGAVIAAYARSERQRRPRRGGGRDHRGEGAGTRRSGESPHPAASAEGVLLRLLRRNREMEDGGKSASVVRPDVDIYNGIVDAWARRVEGKNQKIDLVYAEKAEAWLVLLLRNLEHPTSSTTTIPRGRRRAMPLDLDRGGVIPDAVTYNSVINAYSRIKNSSDAAQRADRWVRTMQEHGVEPTAVTYGCVVKAWASTYSSMGAEKAEAWLEEYEAARVNGVIGSAGEDRDADGGAAVYNATLNALANGGKEDALDRAARLVRRMELARDDVERVSGGEGTDRTIRPALAPPDAVSYNTLLKCAARSAHFDRRKAFSVALECLDLIVADTRERRRIEPDATTIASLLTCVRFCVTPEKEEGGGGKRSDPRYATLLKKIFDVAREGGWVDDRVLKSLRSACEKEIYRDIVGWRHEGARNSSEIPWEWRRNATAPSGGGGRRRSRCGTRGGTGKDDNAAVDAAAASASSRRGALASRSHLPR